MRMAGKLMLYLQYPFVRYAIIVGVLIALCSSLLGVTLVLKRFSYDFLVKFIQRFDGDRNIRYLESVARIRTPLHPDETDGLGILVDDLDGVLIFPGGVVFLGRDGVEMQPASRFAQGFHLLGIQVAPVLLLLVRFFGCIEF